MTAAQRIMHGLENQDSGIEDRLSQSEDELWSEEEVEDTFKLNFGRSARPEECMSDDEVCIQILIKNNKNLFQCYQILSIGFTMNLYKNEIRLSILIN
jgi:hypothetical protein